jgi:hypothetical protein
MFCEAYNQSLTDAAASGEQLSPGLQRHLASCDSCRVAFAEEQSLFAAIDSGLRAAANSEVPATLIPRVHVALNNEPEVRPRRLPLPVSGLAGAAVAAAVIFGLLYLPPKHSPTFKQPVGPSVAASAKNSPDQSASNSVQSGGVSPVQHKRPAVLVASRGVRPESPEVLVPDEERAAFARFLAHASPSSENSLASAALVPRAPKDSVQISPIEIASLELKPLDQKEARQGQF